LSYEEDTYSTIFTALKHPIRRRILRMLGQSPVTYTDILNQLNIDNGLLNYHLDNMKELITKDKEGKYVLSEFGKAALSLTTKVEEPVSKQGDRIFGLNIIQIKSVLTLLIICVGALAVLYVDLNNRYMGIETQYSSLKLTYDTEKTLRSLELNVFVSSIGYTRDHVLEIDPEITLRNPGPLAVKLARSNLTLLIDNRVVREIELDSIDLAADAIYTKKISEANIRVNDPTEVIYRALKTRNLDLKTTVNTIASCGTYDGSINLSYQDQIGFMHTSEDMAGPIYKGVLNLDVPRYFLKYRALVGRLSSAKFPVTKSFGTLDQGAQIITSITDIQTLVTVDDEGVVQTYFLLDGNFSPEPANTSKYKGLIGNEVVYAYGHVFDYYGSDGVNYKVLQPVEISAERMIDMVEVARRYIISLYGEVYFDSYFHQPILSKNSESGYGVSYVYTVWIGKNWGTDFEVILGFDSQRRLVSFEGLPPLDNLQPFNVTRDEAERIGLMAGLPSDNYGLECKFVFWGADDENNTCGCEYRYVWSVNAWLDPSGANPRSYLGAVIDPRSGLVYKVFKGSGYYATSKVDG